MSTDTMRLSRLDHINIVVRDLEVSCRFYGEILGLKKSFTTALFGKWMDKVSGLKGVQADCVFFEFPEGGTRIELLCYHHPKGVQIEENLFPNTVGLRHIAFRVDDLNALVERLKSYEVHIYSEPITVPFPVGAQGLRKRLCYFQDPDGVVLEGAEYTTS